MLDEFLGSEVTILIEEIDFQDLKSVPVVSKSNQSSHGQGEEVPESPEPDAGGKGVVVIGIEPLSIKNCIPRGDRFRMPALRIFYDPPLGKASNHPIQLK